MGRPADYEWAVLGEGQDPVPGDPHEIRDEASHIGKMGQTVRDQIKLLKDIVGDENRGKFADGLIKAADDIKGDLETLATRYEKVSGYLGNWAGDLEYCQSESLRALVKAQQAAPRANAPEVRPAPGSPQPHLTEEQQLQQDAIQTAKQFAQNDLADAKRQLANAVSHRDDRGRYWMQKIEDAEHDGLKDHGFGEWLSKEIHDHAELIKLLADVCTWIVTGLVIAALLIPGLDIGVGILLLGAGLAFAGHTALAVNGDGSWTDVAMDVIAIVTIGTGGVAAKGLRAAGKVAQGLLRGAEAGSGAEEAATGTAEAVAEGSERAATASSSTVMSKLTGKAADYGRYLGRTLRAGGDSGAAENMEKIQEAMKLNPGSRWATNVAARAGSHMNSLRWANVVGNAFDQYGHWTGNSDAVNLVGNGVSTGHWTEGGIMDGGLAHPVLTDGTATHWEPMDRLKELTTHGFE